MSTSSFQTYDHDDDILNSLGTLSSSVLRQREHTQTPTMDCCADCGSVAGEGVSLKACTSCMLARYCSPTCQRNHWPKHRKVCKLRAAELHNEVLFKDPPAKEDCAICFLPMPVKLISCFSLPPATISSVPIRDFVEANKEFAGKGTANYYSCCGKSICGGCVYSFHESGNDGNCPFCNAMTGGKTNEERVEEIMKRVAVNDAGAMSALADCYYNRQLGLNQDLGKALELWKQAAALGSSMAHYNLGILYHEGGDLKKKKFHYEAAAMAGNEVARLNLGCMEYHSGGNVERAVKNWAIAASAGEYDAMKNLLIASNQGVFSRESIDSTLTAYNNSCAEMRSEARDAYIQTELEDDE